MCIWQYGRVVLIINEHHLTPNVLMSLICFFRCQIVKMEYQKFLQEDLVQKENSISLTKCVIRKKETLTEYWKRL